MEIVREAVAEEVVLASTTEGAEADEVAEVIEAQALCCVDHLCGCKDGK